MCSISCFENHLRIMFSFQVGIKSHFRQVNKRKGMSVKWIMYVLSRTNRTRGRFLSNVQTILQILFYKNTY